MPSFSRAVERRSRGSSITLFVSTDVAPEQTRAPAAVVARPARVPELDGLRGLMTVFVVFSHFFVEVPHGIGRFSLGWVAVIVFFVLSGYLVGGLIIERKQARNFLQVFYIRRLCRTVPTYLLVCAAVLIFAAWSQTGRFDDLSAEPVPGWSYFAFAQNALMLMRQSYGHPWLAPTWTLALEEQFYLVAPWLFLLLPRRFWLPALSVAILAGLACRAVGVLTGLVALAPLALLPTSLDVLSIGLLLAVLDKSGVIEWDRWQGLLRLAPILCLFTTAVLQHLDGDRVGVLFQIFGPFLIAVASALVILMLVKGAPEARRFRSPLLAFFGSISYGVYLTHLSVLGLLHAALLGSRPDAANPAQVAVTFAALPATVLVGWLLTWSVEAPLTAWGRRVRWR